MFNLKELSFIRGCVTMTRHKLEKESNELYLKDEDLFRNLTNEENEKMKKLRERIDDCSKIENKVSLIYKYFNRCQ